MPHLRNVGQTGQLPCKMRLARHFPGGAISMKLRFSRHSTGKRRCRGCDHAPTPSVDRSGPLDCASNVRVKACPLLLGLLRQHSKRFSVLIFRFDVLEKICEQILANSGRLEEKADSLYARVAPFAHRSYGCC